MNHPSLDFVAVDFETANAQRASVCQVGLIRVEAGLVVERASRKVIPPTGLDSFDPRNIRIHGITAADAAAGVPWAVALEEIYDFSSGLPFVAYGNFDKGVFTQATTLIGAPVPDTLWYDAAAAARRILTLPDYKLPTVAAHLEIPLLRHHDALADAEAAAHVTLALAQRSGSPTLRDLWPSKSGGTYRDHLPSGTSTPNKPLLPQADPDAAPDHALYGANVVITGDLGIMTRMEAFELIASCGGIPQNNVTLKTTHVVVAEEPRLSREYDPARGRSKERKAAEYAASRGRTIAFMGGRDFTDLVGVTKAVSAPVIRESVQRSIPQPPEAVLGEVSAPPIPASPLEPPVALSSPAPAPAPAFVQPPSPAERVAHDGIARGSSGESVNLRPRSGRGLAVVLAILGWALLVFGAAILIPVTVGLFADGEAAAAVFTLVLAFASLWGGWRLTRVARKRQVQRAPRS